MFYLHLPMSNLSIFHSLHFSHSPFVSFFLLLKSPGPRCYFLSFVSIRIRSRQSTVFSWWLLLLIGGPVQQHDDEGLAQRIQMKPMAVPAEYQWQGPRFQCVYFTCVCLSVHVATCFHLCFLLSMQLSSLTQPCYCQLSTVTWFIKHGNSDSPVKCW